jgi:excisionase family DNA binding protein
MPTWVKVAIDSWTLAAGLVGGHVLRPVIAQRLDIGRMAVYAMLERGILPGIMLGRRWIITRHAYRQWERTCGMPAGAGLKGQPEVTVLN